MMAAHKGRKVLIFQRKAHSGKGGPYPDTHSSHRGPRSVVTPGVVLIFLLAVFPLHAADDWEKYNQPGQADRTPTPGQERPWRERAAQAERAAVERNVHECRQEAQSYERMKRQQRVGPDTYDQTPVYAEAFHKCVAERSGRAKAVTQEITR